MAARRMSEQDLENVLSWRNHPRIRRYMLSQHEISFSEHRAWFDCKSRDDKTALLIIEEGKQPLGCVIFSDIQKNSTTFWSFYSAPENTPGAGTGICAKALDFAFRDLAVNKVAGQVLDFNRASISVHQRLGFKREGNLREHTLVNGKHQNLVCFGILIKEWLVLQKK